MGPLFGSYGYNHAGTGSKHPVYLGLGHGYVEFSRTKQTRETEVVAPSQMIAIADAVNDFFAPGAGYIALNIPPSKETDRWKGAHLTGYNTVFCDGHVSFIKRADFLGATETARRRWNIDNEPHPETWR